MAAQMPKESSHRLLHTRLALPDGGVLIAGNAPAHEPCLSPVRSRTRVPFVDA
jgi:hypothetical protein